MKLLVLVCALLVLGSVVFGATGPTWVGFDTIVFGWPSINNAGQMTRVFGISLPLGLSWRLYLNPVERNRINWFWEIGASLGSEVLENPLGSIGVSGGLGVTFPVKVDPVVLHFSVQLRATSKIGTILESPLPTPTIFPGVGLLWVF